ncbi:coiled-coil domain-containing protein [Oceanobacillus damuensis]|uniref:hypothetical protein n=1 Tax=Oceanobacillus damuensis TaxID=937928 RepID=UPI00082CE3DA|nr:hypothetical protein [Oceanobacillus damuensis]
MYKEINDQLSQIKHAISRKKKWKRQLADYTEELSDIEKQIDILKNQLSDEMEDVRKLENMSFAYLFQTFFGSREEKLSKEKQEAAAVQLQLKEAEKTKKEINDAIITIQSQLADVTDAETDYQYLLSVKEKSITETTPAFAEKLYDISEREGSIQAYITEVEEAITAGNTVNQKLANAVKSLESAKGWGTLDMFGGGAITGLAKHSHIDKATESIHKAQTSMRNFQKELLDISETADVQIDISGLLKFADFFFDGIISDWMVQGRITDSLEQAKNQQSNVESIVRKLEMELKEKERELDAVETERKALIEEV